ncbi:MAG: hypothetical protein HY549_06540 [Elusimicrobia bacterium]|nr:hypothetical protein [Elusimicrobiota bacterium]
MGFSHVPLPAQITLALFGAALMLGIETAFGQSVAPNASPDGRQDARYRSQGQLPDVLIQAEEKRGLPREKPPLDLELKQDEAFSPLLKPEDEIRYKMPSEIAKVTAFTPGLSQSRSPLPSSHWISEAGQGPLRRLAPLKQLSEVYELTRSEDRSKARWELVVVDGGGKAFKRWNGQGAPPELLDFEGRGDDGTWVKAGQVYTAVLTYVDGAGRAHTSMGRPFALPGVALPSDSGAVISLSSRLMFQTEGGSPKLSAEGKRLLGEAALIVQRRYPGLGMEVGAYLSRKEAAWVKSAAEICAKELAERLSLSASAIAAKAQLGAADVEERIEIKVGK